MVRKSLITALIFGLLLTLFGFANSALRIQTNVQEQTNVHPGIPPTDDGDNPNILPEKQHPWGEGGQTEIKDAYNQGTIETNLELTIVLLVNGIIF